MINFVFCLFSLQPIDFTIIKPQTRQFLVDLFTSIYVSSQLSTSPLSLPNTSSSGSSSSLSSPNTKNRGVIEEIFIKATRVSSLAMGLMYWLSELDKIFEVRDDEHQEETEGVGRWLQWANKVALETIKTGLDVVPNL